MLEHLGQHPVSCGLPGEELLLLQDGEAVLVQDHHVYPGVVLCFVPFKHVFAARVYLWG